MQEITFDIGLERTTRIKLIDLFLYFCIFGGITLISGSIVHALEFSIINIAMFFIGLGMTLFGNIAHDCFFVPSSKQKKVNFKNFGVGIITAVSSGSIAGAVLHFEEGPKFAIYLIVCGFVLSIVTTLLYDMRTLKEIFLNYLIKVGMFAGMSFVSGTIVHSINDWFNNYSLIFIGIVLAVGCTLINENLYKKRSLHFFVKETTILVFLTLGIGFITGGVLHIQVNPSYSIFLILIGLGIAVTTAMFKNDSSLVSLRK